MYSEPIPPSWLVWHVMRPVTKVLNPMMGLVAGRRHFGAAALLSHTGRRSGRPYLTPVGAHLTGDTAVIPLTFGNTSDWVKNVHAAGGCLVRLNGSDYPLTRPEFRTAAEARPLVRAGFGPAFRVAFRILGIRQFLVLSLAVPDQDGQP